MLTLFEGLFYGAIWRVASGPRFGRRLAFTRLGRWAERKANESGARSDAEDPSA